MERVFQAFPDIKEAEKWTKDNNRKFQPFPRKTPVFQTKSKTLQKIIAILEKENDNFVIEKEKQTLCRLLSHDLLNGKILSCLSS